MITPSTEAFQDRERSNWVRLRTLVILRWIAIAGQAVALLVGSKVFGLALPIGLAVMAVGSSIVANLFSTFLYPGNKRLSELEALVMLLFDLLQLGLLLYLTGGLNNPFAVLVLAPVTIASTFLSLRSTVFLGLVALCIITCLNFWFLPLSAQDAVELALPELFRFGFWISLMISIVFLGTYARQITGEMHNMADALLATQMALAREQKLTDLGGVVAAAAHELGTPLATIKLVSSELRDELHDQPELREDVDLISEQADRCRDILRSMGRAGKDDLHMRLAPLEAVLREAAEPHKNRGKEIEFFVSVETDHPKRQPIITRHPEAIHGLRNLIQNAVDFAESLVEVESSWDEKSITIRIADDGPGFPQSVIGRIGDPFMRRRANETSKADARPGYEGMGLGLFIAKTLLERSGAKLTFSNGGVEMSGAIVIVEWPREAIETLNPQSRLGDNVLFEG